MGRKGPSPPAPDNTGASQRGQGISKRESGPAGNTQSPPATPGRDERAGEAVEASRALRVELKARFQGEAARRAAANAGRRQATAGEVPAGSEPGHRLPDPGKQIERAKALRLRIRALAAGLAVTEEKVASIHEELARSNPRHADRYRQTAGEARKAADHAREFVRGYTAGTDLGRALWPPS